MAAPDLAERTEQRLTVDAERVAECQQEVLGREVLVGEVAPQRVGLFEDLAQFLRQLGVRAVGVGQLGQGIGGAVAGRGHVDPHLVEHREDDSLLLAQKGDQEMGGHDLGVRGGPSGLTGRRERLGRLECPTIRIERHVGDLQSRA